MRSRIALTAGLGVSLTLLSCVGGDSEQCAWDAVCPPGTTCHEPTQSCVAPKQITACEGLDELAHCEFEGSGLFFRCRWGVCVEPHCGDGVMDSDETCDDGLANSDTAPDACRSDCRSAWCGDGIVDSGEHCDEGSENSNVIADACRTNCQSPVCGDGVMDQGEQCDGADLGGMACADLGFTEGLLQCSSDCHHIGCSCVDTDGDGFGEGCSLGPDCDDQAPGITGPCQANGCPQGWAYIPAGDFEMGCSAGELDGTCQSSEQPRHTVTMSAYCIEITEVRVASYRSCMDTGACTGSPLDTSTNTCCNWSADVGGIEHHPINCIDWADSRQYCQAWVGGDLPTEAQWEKAARGGPGDLRKYPWGAGPEPDCTHANFDVNGGASGYGCSSTTVPPFTWEVGHLVGTSGNSPYGLKDMAGNVWEWAQDFFDAAFYSQCSGGCSDPLNTTSISSRSVRGGGNLNDGGFLRVVKRDGTDPLTRDCNGGFRCSRSP